MSYLIIGALIVILIGLGKEHANLAKEKEMFEKGYKAAMEKIKTVESVGKTLDQSLKTCQSNLEKVSKKYFSDGIKFILSKLTASNFATSHKNADGLISFIEKNGTKIPNEEKASVAERLKAEYQEIVRKDLARQEQARIKEQIREEQRLEREREQELKRIENERLAIEQALNVALKRAKDDHDVEVERLRTMLTEAEAKLQRAKSMAELTKAGHVYVISNIGSFGKDVFKVGMTRRLEPMDRVKELGDASVPFPFDVHMMISCDDAPALENALHNQLHQHRVNKVNLRKEFFSVELARIRNIVEKHHGRVDYVADPDALEYYDSQSMSEEDFAFVSEQHAQELSFAAAE
jgi:hypothetical protein